MKRGVPAADGSGDVRGDTPVYSTVRVLLTMQHFEEEQWARAQDDAVALSLVHELSILVPRDPRLRLALGFTVESDWLVARNHHVRRVLRDPWTPKLPWNREREESQKHVWR